MPAMKRPAAASAPAAPAALRRKCEAIAEAVELSEGLSPSMKAMLSAGVLSSMGTAKDKRHPLQVKVGGWISDALAGVKAAAEEKRAAAAKVVADSEGEKTSREQRVEDAKKLQAEQHAAAAARKEEKKAAAEAVKAAKEALKEVTAAQEDGDKELKDVEEKKAPLLAASEAFAKLKSGVLAEDEDSEKLTALVTKCGADNGFDPSMMTALPSAFTKEPSARGQFDNLVLEQFTEEHAKKVAELDALLAEGAPAKEARAAKVAEAASALEAATEAEAAASSAHQEAVVAQSDADAAVKTAKDSVRDYASDMKEAKDTLKEAEANCKYLAKGALSDFEDLKEFDGTLAGAGSQYRHIDGVRYEKDLLDLAAQTDEISKEAAEALFTAAMDGPGVTPTEKRTLQYIVKKKPMGADAKSYLTTKMGSSWYQTIDGVKYERLLLSIAEDATAEGKTITMEVAEKLWKSAMDANQVTPTEKKTLEHILATKAFEPDAKALLESHVAEADVPAALAALEEP